MRSALAELELVVELPSVSGESEEAEEDEDPPLVDELREATTAAAAEAGMKLW